MAFSTLAQSIDDVIKARENELVQKIAAKFNIDEKELRAEFNLGHLEIKAKKQYKKRTVKEVTVTGEDGQPVKSARKECSATTAKKEPCKFAALKDCNFCKRHQKAFEEEQQPKEKTAATPSPKPTKEITKDPVHNHFMDGQAHEECELCQIQGPPDAEGQEYEEVTTATQLVTEPEQDDPFAADD